MKLNTVSPYCPVSQRDTHAMSVRAIQARARRSPDGPALHSVMRLAPCLRLSLMPDPMRMTAPLSKVRACDVL